MKPLSRTLVDWSLKIGVRYKESYLGVFDGQTVVIYYDSGDPLLYRRAVRTSLMLRTAAPTIKYSI